MLQTNCAIRTPQNEDLFVIDSLKSVNVTRITLCGQAAAQEGATAPPSLEDVVDLHFVALVEVNGR